eukprot:601817-Alexandrium_andersonii.AAC.1
MGQTVSTFGVDSTADGRRCGSTTGRCWPLLLLRARLARLLAFGTFPVQRGAPVVDIDCQLGEAKQIRTPRNPLPLAHVGPGR